MKRFSALCLALLFLAFSAHTAVGAPAASGGTVKKTMPTNIKADSVEYNAGKQTVVFTGNVHVKRPDFEMWSLKMTVYLDKSGKSEADDDSGTMSSMQAGDIDRIVAEGKVRLKSEDRHGTSNKATYYVKTDRFVMEGSPVLTDKDTVIRGHTIVHYLEANKSDVQGADFTFTAPDKTGPAKIGPSSPKTQQQSQQ